MPSSRPMRRRWSSTGRTCPGSSPTGAVSQRPRPLRQARSHRDHGHAIAARHAARVTLDIVGRSRPTAVGAPCSRRSRCRPMPARLKSVAFVIGGAAPDVSPRRRGAMRSPPSTACFASRRWSRRWGSAPGRRTRSSCRIERRDTHARVTTPRSQFIGEKDISCICRSCSIARRCRSCPRRSGKSRSGAFTGPPPLSAHGRSRQPPWMRDGFRVAGARETIEQIGGLAFAFRHERVTRLPFLCLVAACAGSTPLVIEPSEQDTKADGMASRLELLDDHRIDLDEPSNSAFAGGRLYAVSDRHSKIYELDDDGDVQDVLDVEGTDLRGARGRCRGALLHRRRGELDGVAREPRRRARGLVRGRRR